MDITNTTRPHSKRKKRRENELKAIEDLLYSVGQNAIPTDVLGSYTGTSADGSPPVQDADDL